MAESTRKFRFLFAILEFIFLGGVVFSFLLAEKIIKKNLLDMLSHWHYLMPMEIGVGIVFALIGLLMIAASCVCLFRKSLILNNRSQITWGLMFIMGLAATIVGVFLDLTPENIIHYSFFLLTNPWCVVTLSIISCLSFTVFYVKKTLEWSESPPVFFTPSLSSLTNISYCEKDVSSISYGHDSDEGKLEKSFDSDNIDKEEFSDITKLVRDNDDTSQLTSPSPSPSPSSKDKSQYSYCSLQ